ncbi:protamine-like [Camponotus floridanus]|uniref:protamine-like n=1 Tax=Camponotus floridanus TaxID=104421 RepID=UPI000DC68D1C|nr:protamine-like [Camponotus floridanus]
MWTTSMRRTRCTRVYASLRRGLDARKGRGWFERPKDGGERTRNSRWKQRTAVGSSGWQVEGGKGVTAAASSSGGGGSSSSSNSSGSGSSSNSNSSNSSSKRRWRRKRQRRKRRRRRKRRAKEQEEKGGRLRRRRCRRRRASPVGWVGLVCTSTTPAPTWFQAKERMG